MHTEVIKQDVHHTTTNDATVCSQRYVVEHWMFEGHPKHDTKAECQMLETDLDSDDDSVHTPDTQPTAARCVWTRMGSNIAIDKLNKNDVAQLIIDGMRTEDGRSERSIKVRADTPDWKRLALSIIQSASIPMSNDAFEQKWTSSTVRAQGCEVLIELSRESDAVKHEQICRDEVFGKFYDHTSLSECDLAKHTMLMFADKIIEIMQQRAVDGYMYWNQGGWIHEVSGSSMLAADISDSCVGLLTDLANHHHESLISLKQKSQACKKDIVAAEKKRNASYSALNRFGYQSNRMVMKSVLDAKKRMAIPQARDPFDEYAKQLLPFTNGVMDLSTGVFRPIRKQDYILLTTGHEWHEPTPEKVERMRKLFESIQPNNRVRKTLYCMLRLCLGARVEEIFWLLTGNGRNGKGLLMLWMEHLQSKALFSTMPICALTVPLDGEGPSPELRKAHRRRILNFTEPPEEEDDEGGLRTHKKGLRVLLSNVKILTGEPSFTARECRSNDSDCALWSTPILQCNTRPTLVGKIDEAILERIVEVNFPYTFTSDAEKLRSNPDKYKKKDTSLKDKAFMDEHCCALVRLLLEECPDGKLYIAPECKIATNAYLSGQDPFQAFLDEHCTREETAPARQWLGLKDMLARYNTEMDTKLTGATLKKKLNEHLATSSDFKGIGEGVITDTPLKRNSANGLLNWRLKTPADEASGSKKQRAQ